MSTTTVPELMFSSLAALRAEHRELQKIYRDQAITPAMTLRIEDFIRRGRATGAILDDEEDQAAAQALLDFWGTCLYRGSNVVPDTTLAPFDSSAAPILDDSLVPYVGLGSFTEGEKELFFGRGDLVASLVEHLRQQNLLAISGPSGSGKSSLVLAGIVPALKNGALPGSKDWRYLGRMVPGSAPFENLAKLLLRGHENGNGSVGDLAEQLKKKPESLCDVLAMGDQGRVVLVIDQFEELSTLCEDNAVREAFEKALVGFAGEGAHSGGILILTMRSDFIGAVARQPELQNLLETGLVPITPLSAAELRAAITRPAERVGLKFETGIVEPLVHDILGEPAALPLLQFTLLKLWEHRDHNRITAEAYRELGGGRLALTRCADKFINGLIPQERIMAERILLRLVRPGIGQDNVANRIRKVSLYSIDAKENVDRVLNKLVHEHLVRLTEGEVEADSEVEVAHEALVRNWQHLVSLLDAERERMTTLRRLELKAGEWVRLGRGTAGLLRDAALVEAEQWLANPDFEALGASSDLRHLVSASRRAANAARKRESMVKFALAGLALAALMLAIGALIQTHRARTQTALANQSAEEARKQTYLANVNWDKLQAANKELKKALGNAEDEKAKAVTAELNSESQARLFVADKLADEAEDALADDPERAVLLATRSSLLLSAYEQKPTPSIESAVYKAAQSNRLRVSLPTPNRVISMAFSADGTRLATAETKQPVRVWDASTGKQTQSIPQSSGAGAVAYSLDNREIAAAFDHKVLIFDASSGQLEKALNSNIRDMEQLLFSPDGSYLIGVGSGRDPEIWALHADSGPQVLKPKGTHAGTVSAAAFSPTGALIITGDDKGVRLWDSQSATFLREFEHAGPITGLAFHPDGVHFASASKDGSIRFWSLAPVPAQGTASYKFGFSSSTPTYGGAIAGISFTADGKSFTAVAEDGTVSIWNVATGRQIDQFPVRPLTAVAFSLDGSRLAISAEGAPPSIWIASPGLGQVIGGHNGAISDLTESMDEDKILTASTADGKARGWDLSQPGREFAIEFEITEPSERSDLITALAFNTDAKYFIAGSKKGAVYWQGEDNQASEGKLFSPILESPVSSVALTPDGKGAAVATSDGSMYSGNLQTFQLEKLTTRFKVNNIAFSHNGEDLATAGEDRTVKLWNWNSLRSTGEPKLVLRGHAGAVTSVAFSSDDKLLASSGSDGVVKIWSIAGKDAGTNILTFNTGSTGASHVRFVHKDTGLLVAGQDGVLRLFPIMIHNEMPAILGAVTRNFRTEECGDDCSRLGPFVQDTDEANRLAKSGDTAGALAKLESAQKSIPGLALNAPEEIKLLQQETNGEAARQATRGYVAEATVLARAQLTPVAGEVKKKLNEQYGSTVNLDDLSGQARAAAANALRATAPYVAENGNEELVRDFFKRIQLPTGPTSKGKADPDSLLNEFLAETYVKAAQMQIQSRGFDKALELLSTAKKYSTQRVLLARLEPLPTDAAAAEWFNAELCQKTGVAINTFDGDPTVPKSCEAAARAAAKKGELVQELQFIVAGREHSKGQFALDRDQEFNNNLCWSGSIGELNLAKNPEVIAACERAVALSKGLPAYRDSRGVNRARNGDYGGAIEDFQSLASDPSIPKEYRDLRQRWIGLLQKGQDPFTPDVLKEMQRGW